MGLYIKGMEMPKDPFYPVHATIYADGTVITGHGIGESAKEAVPVPPHGRLIDEEALAQDAYRRMLECAKYERPDEKPYEVLRAIEFAPTVIPAEEDTNAEFELKWAVGAVKCQKCGYEWVAVRPVEASELECPKCGAFEGRTKMYEQEDTNGE